MSYLPGKNTKRNFFLIVAVAAFLFFLLVYFQWGISNALSRVFHTIFKPIVVLSKNISENISAERSFLLSKETLFLKNKELENTIAERDALLLGYNFLLEENNKLKEILGRKDENTQMLLAAILLKPNRSPYDTLIVDVGTREEVLEGATVFALGNIPIGYVVEVYPRTSKVKLFSTPGEKVEVVIGSSDVFLQAIGRGGGNFEIILPREFTVEEGSLVYLPGLRTQVVGKVEKIISDPRDSFKKALIIGLVNIQELGLVQIERQ